MREIGSFSDWTAVPLEAVDGDVAVVRGQRFVMMGGHWHPDVPVPGYGDRPMGVCPPAPMPPVPPVGPRHPHVVDHYGDMRVHGDVAIGGKLRVQEIRQPNMGLYKTYEALVRRYPRPCVGMWAIVGDNVPGAIYRCDRDGYWTATGETGGGGAIDVDEIMTDVEEALGTYDADISELRSAVNNEAETRQGGDMALQARVQDLQSAADSLGKIARGDESTASAWSNPFINLGNYTTQAEVNAKLNTVYHSNDIKYNGLMRISRNGAVMQVSQHAIKATGDAWSWAQCVAGMVQPSGDGTALDAAGRWNVCVRWTDYLGNATPWKVYGGAGGDIQLKTVNGQSLKGEGNIEITAEGQITIDDTVSEASANAVSSRAVASAIADVVNAMAAQVSGVRSDVTALDGRVTLIEHSGAGGVEEVRQGLANLLQSYTANKELTDGRIETVETKTRAIRDCVGAFAGTVGSATVQGISYDGTGGEVVYVQNDGTGSPQFAKRVAQSGGGYVYYNNWTGASAFKDMKSGSWWMPREDAIYINTALDRVYTFDGKNKTLLPVAGDSASVDPRLDPASGNAISNAAVTSALNAQAGQISEALTDIASLDAVAESHGERLSRLETTKDRSCGLFASAEALEAAYPTPEVGDWALVGDDSPFAVYGCATAGTWADTGGEYDGGSIDLDGYVTEDDIPAIAAEISEGSARVSVTGLGQGATASEDIVYARFKGVSAGHTYRLHIQKPEVDYTGIEYSSSGYLRLLITVRDGEDANLLTAVNIGFDATTALASYYDIVIPPSATGAEQIRVAFRAAEGFEEWFQLEDITDGAYLPNISLVGRGNDIVYSSYYKGVKGGRKYRVLIKSKNISMSGVTNHNSRLIIYLVDLSDIVLDTTTQVARWNYSDTLPDYYDVDVPDNGIDYALHYCMRAAVGAEQILEVVDITDAGQGGGNVTGLFNYATLTGNGQTPVLTECYRGLKQGRKYRFVIKNTGIDMTGCSGSGYARLSILLREKDHIDLPYNTDSTRIDAFRVNIGSPLPETADITVPDDGKEYYVQLFMRAAVGAEQLFTAYDVTDLREEEGPLSVSLAITSNSALANTGWVGEFEGGKTYRVILSDPSIDISTNVYKDNAYDYDLFDAQYTYYDEGVAVESAKVNFVKKFMRNWPLDAHYDITLPDDGKTYAMRFYQRASSGETMTYTVAEVSGEAAVEAVGAGTSMLSLIQGNIGQDGKTSESSEYVHTSPIAGGRGFYILLNEGYEIHDMHLFNADGTIASYSYLPLGLDRPPSSTYKRESGLRCYYSNMTMPQGYYMVLVITKVTTSGGMRSAITTGDKAVAEFTYMDNPHLHAIPWTADPWVGTLAQYNALSASQKASLDCIVVEGSDAVPYIPQDKAKMLKDRYKSITNAVWTPKANVPVAGSTSSNHWADYLYLKGRARIGVCYSEAAQYSKYVGQHVSLYTFLTAARNKRSVLYTENIRSRTSKYGYTYCDSNALYSMIAPFYGTVCSGLTAHVLCLANIAVAAKYSPTATGKVPGLTLVPNGDSTNVLPMDIIAYSSHVAMVTDVYLDDDGERKLIVWTEMTRPFAISSPMTCEQFDKRLADKRASEAVYILRPDSYDAITAPLADPVQKDYMQMPQELEDCAEICTHLGDKPAVGLTDILYLNCFRGTSKYTSCVIEKSTDHGETWITYSTVDITSLDADTLYPEDGEDWVRVNLCATKTYGLYRAHLTGTGTSSGYTYWEVLDNSASYSGGTITFGHAYGTPYLIRQERSLHGYMLSGTDVMELTSAEASSGSVTVAWTQNQEDGGVIKVFWKGDYGVAVKELQFT